MLRLFLIGSLFWRIPQLIVLRESIFQNVPSGLINAIIQVESAGEIHAFRDEPSINDASYGLMQILEGTARQLGYQGDVQGLFNPSTNIRLGVKYIRFQIDRFGSFTDAIAAYNAGSVFRDADGNYTNQSYVDKVAAIWG